MCGCFNPYGFRINRIKKTQRIQKNIQKYTSIVKPVEILQDKKIIDEDEILKKIVRIIPIKVKECIWSFISNDITDPVKRIFLKKTFKNILKIIPKIPPQVLVKYIIKGTIRKYRCYFDELYYGIDEKETGLGIWGMEYDIIYPIHILLQNSETNPSQYLPIVRNILHSILHIYCNVK